MLKKNITSVLLLLIFAITTYSQVPKLINYQGRLIDSGGTPVTGTLSMEFKIYNTASGTTHLWTELQSVVVTDGNFNVLLGAVNPIPYDVFNAGDKYLGIKIGVDPEMTPRKRLVSVGYAFQADNADNVDGKDASDFVQIGQANSISSGMIQNNAVTKEKITPDFVSSVDGVKNDGGNIDLVGGSNITITPDDGNNKITISASSSGDNLGNHEATQNIKLNSKWLSNDGGNAGLKIDNSGKITTNNDISVGDDIEAQGYITSNSYIEATNSSSSSQAKAIHGIMSSTSTGGFSAAVRGESKGTGGNGIGVYGSQNGSGWGVHGTTPSGRGVYGTSTSGTGVYGYHSSSSGTTPGVYGATASRSNSAIGVHGVVSSTSASGFSAGVRGENKSTSGQGIGVYGSQDGSGWGIYGKVPSSTSGYAGYFGGRVRVTGTLSKGGGSFQIDHPLDPSNKYLSHSFVESPDMKNVYDGVVTLNGNGESRVELPEWFQALNEDFRYQLTAIGAPAPNLYIAEEVNNNSFKIAGGSAGMKISWQITGIRHDPFAEKYRIQVEEEKSSSERGYYLHPDVYGKSKQMSIERALQPEIE